MGNMTCFEKGMVKAKLNSEIFPIFGKYFENLRIC